MQKSERFSSLPPTYDGTPPSFSIVSKEFRTREGLTLSQAKFADMLFETIVDAPIGRRKTNPDGSFEFSKKSERVSVFQIAASREKGFVQAIHEEKPDAPLSPFYISMRNLPPEFIQQAGVVLSEVPGRKADVCTGIPNAGADLAKAYSEASGVTFIDLFDKEETNDGSIIIVKKNIPGFGKEENIPGFGRELSIIDDLAAHGKRKIEAIKAAVIAGFKVTEVRVLIDRMQGAREELEEFGVELKAAMTLEQILRYQLRQHRIDRFQLAELMSSTD